MVSKAVVGKVTLVVRDVPIRDAFDIILRSSDLAYTKTGPIYYIMADAEYKKLYGKSFSDIRIVKTYRLAYAVPEQVFNFIDALKSDIGRVVVDQESGTVVVLDTAESIKEIDKAVISLERKGTSKVFSLKYAKALDIQKYLQDELTAKKLGTVTADERSNQVVVYTLPGKMLEVETMIEAFDKKTPQVFINAQIIKITVTDDLDTGIQWQVIFSDLSKYLMRMMNRGGVFNLAGSFPLASTITDFGTLTIGSVTDDGYTYTMNFIKALGQTKILSNPRLSVLNNEEARIHVGRREVYVTTTTTTGQTTQTTAEEVTFIDVGIQLAVTPTINDDGYITMKIQPEISSVVDSYTTPSGNVIPIVDTSLAESTVVVKDGSTIIIGGLRRNDKTETHQGVPYLMDIPVVGEIFKQRDDMVETTELLIMITPTITKGDRLVTGDKHMDTADLGFGTDRDYEKIEYELDEEMSGTVPRARQMT